MKQIRRYHRRLSIIFALPILIIVVTGTLLILRSKLAFIQTPTPKVASVAIEKIRPISQVILKLKSISIEKENISSIIFKPGKNIYSIRTKDYQEIILHPETLEVLSIGPKLSILLMKIHEGTYFSKSVRDFIFLPTSIGFIFLWGTGITLFFRTRKRFKRVKRHK